MPENQEKPKGRLEVDVAGIRFSFGFEFSQSEMDAFEDTADLRRAQQQAMDRALLAYEEEQLKRLLPFASLPVPDFVYLAGESIRTTLNQPGPMPGTIDQLVQFEPPLEYQAPADGRRLRLPDNQQISRRRAEQAAADPVAASRSAEVGVEVDRFALLELDEGGFGAPAAPDDGPTDAELRFALLELE